MNVIMRVVRWISNIPYRLRCRFEYKQYMIPLPGFSKWEWHEDHDRVLHGMMEVMRHYVEEQRPWDVSSILDGKIDDLMSQLHNEKNEDTRAMLESQFNDAIEVHNIYRWWKKYPLLKQNIEDLLHKWSEMCGEFKFVEISEEDEPDVYKEAREFNIIANKDEPLYETTTDETKEEKDESDKVLHEMWAAEDELEQQETDMLCRLIKVRGRMWT